MLDGLDSPRPALARAREDAGRRAHLVGHAAEAAVARRYAQEGGATVAQRWRGSCGEIDLIVRDGDEVVFIEVKRARNFARAAERLTAPQVRRIMGAASEFLGALPSGQLTPTRFDLATVDQTGRVDILKGAFGV